MKYKHTLKAAGFTLAGVVLLVALRSKSASGHRLAFSVKPFQIVTIRIR
jgi:hypothetical protein